MWSSNSISLLDQCAVESELDVFNAGTHQLFQGLSKKFDKLRITVVYIDGFLQCNIVDSHQKKLGIASIAESY